MKFLFAITLNCLLFALACEGRGYKYSGSCPEEAVKNLFVTRNAVLDELCTIKNLIEQLTCEKIIKKFTKEYDSLNDKVEDVLDHFLEHAEYEHKKILVSVHDINNVNEKWWEILEEAKGVTGDIKIALEAQPKSHKPYGRGWRKQRKSHE